VVAYNVTHRTSYEYEALVLHAHHLAHLRPRALPHQQVLSSEMVCTPTAKHHHAYLDYFGNESDAIELLDSHDSFEVVTRSRVQLTQREPLVRAQVSQSYGQVRDWLLSPEASVEAVEFACDSPLVRAHALFREYAGSLFAEGRALPDIVLDLNQRIFEDFTYVPLATDVSTPLAQVMRERRGVCQDFAHVAVACLRSWGISARYISGYLETVPPPGVQKLTGADASHAWAAAFIPGYGWLEFDPTNGVLPTNRHIVLGWGRDFSDVTPLKGVVFGGGAHRVTVGVDVEAVSAV
jgi:transglutaminase-like putative cysteine protease